MIIGVDIGGTSIKVGMVNELGSIIDRFSYKVDHTLNQEEQIKELAIAINIFIEKTNVLKQDIVGIGIGCPGAINSNTGVCDYSNNIKFSNLPICKIITEITGLKSKITNDANAATLAEAYFGAGKNYNNVIMLTVGTGVGGGIVIDKKLYEGNEGKGAELGHSLLVLNGRKCTCGRKGCLETYASASAFVNDCKEMMIQYPNSMLFKACDNDLDKIDGKIIFECAKQNDECAIKVLEQYSFYLSEGILNYCNIFRPDAIIIGGGLSFQKEYLTDRINDYCKKENYGFGGCPAVYITYARLGNDAGIIGAACLLM